MPGVGMPARLRLDQFGEVVREAFGHCPYLVGSAARGKEWRDVDVRLILPDDEFEQVVGELTRPRCLNLRWNALCLAFAALGHQMTGLPIDFQIDQQTQANEEHDGLRHALHVVDGRRPAALPHGSDTASAPESITEKSGPFPDSEEE
jgi:hypothetical protein